MLGDGSQHPDHHHYHGALLFQILFKCAVRPDWKCRGCVVMIVMISAGALLFQKRFTCAVRPDWNCRGCVVMIVMITAADAGNA